MQFNAAWLGWRWQEYTVGFSVRVASFGSQVTYNIQWMNGFLDVTFSSLKHSTMVAYKYRFQCYHFDWQSSLIFCRSYGLKLTSDRCNPQSRNLDVLSRKTPHYTLFHFFQKSGTFSPFFSVKFNRKRSHGLWNKLKSMLWSEIWKKLSRRHRGDWLTVSTAKHDAEANAPGKKACRTASWKICDTARAWTVCNFPRNHCCPSLFSHHYLLGV